jgi:hypothetical protein
VAGTVDGEEGRGIGERNGLVELGRVEKKKGKKRRREIGGRVEKKERERKEGER